MSQHISVPSRPILNGSVAALLTFASLFSDVNAYAGNKVCTIRADSKKPVYLEIWVEILTAFNATTANSVSVGTSQNGSDLIAAGSITAGTAGFYPASNVKKQIRITADTDIYFRSAGNFASSTLTSDNTAPANNSTVTIGGKVYTFKTALTPAEGEVLINSTADAALLNLIRAINHSGTPGTDYQCAAANAQVSAATSVTSHAFLVTALAGGTAGNAIVTTSTTSPNSHMTWTGGTLAGGTDPTAGEAKLYIQVTPLYPLPSTLLNV